jgi:hypothetical protein
MFTRVLRETRRPGGTEAVVFGDVVDAGGVAFDVVVDAERAAADEFREKIAGEAG